MSTLNQLYERVDDIEIAMMTTRRPDGHLRSRAMATQRAMPGADLWFVTRHDSGKVAELRRDAHLNLSYFRDSNMEWVSVSGQAVLTDDRAKIHELYAPDWATWFAEEGDARHGTPDDPRMLLIGVTVHAAEFLAVDRPRPLLLFELAKGWFTGEEPKVGEVHRLERPQRPA